MSVSICDNGHKKSNVLSAYVNGLNVFPITVEAYVVDDESTGIVFENVPETCLNVCVNSSYRGVDYPPGTPTVDMRTLVHDALSASGYRVDKHVTVRITPAVVDRLPILGAKLAVAVAVLEATDQIEPTNANALFYGSITADGHVKPMPGTVSVHQYCAQNNFSCVVGRDHIVTDPDTGCVHALNKLSELKQGLELGTFDPCLSFNTSVFNIGSMNLDEDVKTTLKRAMYIRQNIVLVGSVSTGVAVASWLRTLQRVTTRDQRDVVEAALSLSCFPDSNLLDLAIRPQEEESVRPSPYRYTDTHVCNPYVDDKYVHMFGGGYPVCPGAVTLAHGGTLVLTDSTGEGDVKLVERIARVANAKVVQIMHRGVLYKFPADVQVIVCVDARDADRLKNLAAFYKHMFDAIVVDVSRRHVCY